MTTTSQTPQPTAPADPGGPITGVPCKNCQGPVPAPRRRGVVKEFCGPRCRSAWRTAQLQLAIRDTLEALADSQLVAERLQLASDRLVGFLATRRPRKKRLDTV